MDVDDELYQLASNRELLELSRKITERVQEIVELMEKEVEIVSNVLMKPRDEIADVVCASTMHTLLDAQLRRFEESAIRGLVMFVNALKDYDRFRKCAERAMEIIEEINRNER